MEKGEKLIASYDNPILTAEQTGTEKGVAALSDAAARSAAGGGETIQWLWQSELAARI